MMKFKMMKVIIFIFSIVASMHVKAEGSRVYRTSFSFLPLATSTKQGGNGPEGSTLMTHFEFGVHKPAWGYGFVYQVDQHGDFQKDTGLGLKLEASYKAVYFDLGYLIDVQRVYNDRTYEKEKGNGYFVGFGGRVNFGKRYFFNLSYKYRVHKISKQDDTALSETITQTDSYPLIGIGVSF